MDEELNTLSTYQQNPLEYKPDLSVEKEQKIVGGFLSKKEDGEETYYVEEEKGIGDGLLTDEIFETVQIQEEIQTKINLLKDELKGLSIKVDDTHVSTTEKAKNELGLENADDGQISFEDYVFALEHSDTQAGSFIVSLFEDKIEDVDGNLKAELFSDLFEMNKELEHLTNYINVFILNKLIGDTVDLSSKNAKELILTSEKTFKEIYSSVKDTYEESVVNYRESLLFYPENRIKANEAKHETSKDWQLYENKRLDLDSAYTTLSSKNMEIGAMFLLIDSNLDRESIPDKSDVVSSLTSIIKSEEDANKALTTMALMLKLSVDSDNEEKYNIKNQLRNTYSIEKREKLLEEYKTDQELYDKTVLDLSHRLNFYDSNMDESTTSFLNAITKSMLVTSNEKTSKEKEYFNITNYSSSLREQKINNVLEKDDSRQSYAFVKSLAKQIDEQGMPSISNYSQYLN